MATKAEQRAAVLEEINRACADVDEEFRPSPWQFTTFKSDVDWLDGCDPDGYFLGRCPLAMGKPHPARFNFLKGVMRCDPDEDRPSCHEPTHTLSLANAGVRRG